MWSYVVRRLLYNIPVYLGIILLVMAALRVNDPVTAYLGKNATEASYNEIKADMGLDKSFLVQYARVIGNIATLNFGEVRSWEQERPIDEIITTAVPATAMITVPALVITASISILIGLICAFTRGRWIDKTLMFVAVIGMSISFLVYIIVGQYWGGAVFGGEAGVLPFEIEGYNTDLSTISFWASNPLHAAHEWLRYCGLPVLISVIVAMGYDTRFYRAVMVEETGRDYITTARAKGATSRKIMFVHMLKNAMIPIITRIMISLPFLIVGSILLEYYFGIPGMGRTLITAITSKDFPVVEYMSALFAAVVIVTVILTDVLYALVDPRVRLS
ncbi:MAG: ABC transporter permease [Planctomycetota bacterium]